MTDLVLYNGLPLFNAGLDETCEITAVSLVEFPATELPMFHFSKEMPKQIFSVTEPETHRIISCIVRVNHPIYRVTSSGYQYYMNFTVDVARELCKRLISNGYQNCVSVDHNGKLINGINLEELFIKDNERGINPVGFEDAAEGSLFGIYHVTDEELWSRILNNDFGGVSLESYLTLEEPKELKENNLKNIFSKMVKLRDKLAAMLLKFDTVLTDKGELIYDREGEPVEGDSVYILDEQGERVKPEDNDYIVDGQIFVVKDGVIAEIKEVPVEESIPEKLEDIPAPETPAEEPVDNITPRIEDIEARLAELETKLEEIAAKLNTPVAEPIVEEFTKATTPKISDNKYVNLFKTINK